MNAPEAKRLIDQVPKSIRAAVKQSGEFQRMVSDFVRLHVHQGLSELVDRLRNAEGFDEELEQLYAKPDYLAACNENGVEIVQDGDVYYHFRWPDANTIEVGTDGKGYVDFPKFAADHGLDLAAWAWDKLNDQPILRSEVNDENAADIDVELDVLSAVIKHSTYPDGQDVIDALAFIAKAAGKSELAAALEGDDKRQDLLSGYVLPASVLCVDEFHGQLEAAENACDTYNLQPDVPEIYEYWAVDDTLAYHLEERGEVVAKDFVGLTVWGRATTGQMISSDHVIEEIFMDFHEAEVEALLLKQFPHVGKHDENLEGVPVDLLKAVEEGRLTRVEYEFKNGFGNEQHTVDHVVHAAGDETKGWMISSLRYGTKHGMTPGAAEPIAKIEKDIIQARGEPFGAGLTSRALNQAEIDDLVDDIKWLHTYNGSSPLHKVPENLDERLSKLSPAYAAKLAATNDGPSLG